MGIEPVHGMFNDGFEPAPFPGERTVALER